MSLLKHPSAYLPIAMSLAALSLLFGYVALYGLARQEDEGGAAHTFQLLMVAQVPIIGWFAARWLPRLPRDAALVLALQIGAAATTLLVLLWLEW